MDEELKQQFEKTCDDLGLNMSTAVVMLAKKMTREQRIPFDVSVDPFYGSANMNALRESVEQMHSGRVVRKTLEELDGLADE